MKPKFSPDQDMSDVSPEDVAEAKKRAKAAKAYDRAQKYAAGGMARPMPAQAMGAKPAMTGLDRAAAMSGRTFKAGGSVPRGEGAATRSKKCKMR
jgi:hypothetical protein